MSWSLSIKALVFGASLWFFGSDGFHLGDALVFLVIAAVLYNYHIFNTFSFLLSFLFLLVVSFRLISMTVGSWWLLPVILVLAFLFYVVLGLKNLALISRLKWHYGLQAVLSYLFFLTIFFNSPAGGVWSTIFVFLMLFIALMEFFRIQAPTLAWQRRILFSWLLSLLLSQISWLVALLPIGFVGVTNLMMLIVFFLADSTLRHLRVEITKAELWKRFFVVFLLSAIVLLTSRWN